MKRTIFTLTMLLVTVASAMAQDIKLGYFSYKALLQSMPDYSVATASLDKLRRQYADELSAAQKEFNEKYELFLDQQASLAESIRQKRQADLQTLLERNEDFKSSADRLLKDAEKQLMAPLHDKLKAAIAKAGEQGGYLIIVNTDSEACPYIAPQMAVDVTEQLMELTK
ncbi:MAG: OmpH family outer membrane protein [Prevotellaceae bacterium]|nr:OmpH family outer membrane protein [Prevotellaceae bacterium]MDO4932657.1 OmpH family outer membrane protein [Prevotellaceae bacterium]